MNKKTLKILLIILGGIITLITFLLSLIEADFSMANAIDYYFEELLFIIILEPQSILTVMGPLLIIIGLFIDKKNKNVINDEIYIGRKIKKYKILRIIGLLPFIIVICSGIFSMFNGNCFFNNCSYGSDALFETILLTSWIIWPLYIIGIILIIFSTLKLK